jgi:putative transposase
MTYRAEYSIPDDLLEEIAEQGLDVVPELIRILINAAMRIERQRYLEPVMNFAP